VSLKRLRIHADARTELLRETLHYETHRTGTGKRFREAVAAAFGVLRHFPASGAIGPSGTCKLKVKGLKSSFLQLHITARCQTIGSRGNNSL
jgi:hypothetical protein